MYPRHYKIFFSSLYLSGCKDFNEKQTGEAIAKQLLEIMSEYGIEGKVLFVITDGASAMLAGKIFFSSLCKT